MGKWISFCVLLPQLVRIIGPRCPPSARWNRVSIRTLVWRSAKTSSALSEPCTITGCVSLLALVVLSFKVCGWFWLVSSILVNTSVMNSSSVLSSVKLKLLVRCWLTDKLGRMIIQPVVGHFLFQNTLVNTGKNKCLFEGIVNSECIILTVIL